MDSESDAELSPEIKLKSRKRVLPPVTRPLQDSSHTFLLNTTSPVGKEGTFCRSSYVQNIFSHDDVLCCVLSTFTLDFPYLIDELPCILSPSASVECMLVHGRLSNQSKLGLRGGSLKYSSKLRLVEVSPQHKRTSHMGFVQHATHIMGVHHPKYLLIFVTLGVHVIISSSNLTPSQNSTDITWSQFFPVQPFTLDRQPVPGSEGGRGRAYGTDTGNDFGAVLEDFLKQVRGHHQLIADVHASLCDGVVMVNGVCVAGICSSASLLSTPPRQRASQCAGAHGVHLAPPAAPPQGQQKGHILDTLRFPGRQGTSLPHSHKTRPLQPFVLCSVCRMKGPPRVNSAWPFRHSFGKACTRFLRSLPCSQARLALCGLRSLPGQDISPGA
jgi:hypothetical protein